MAVSEHIQPVSRVRFGFLLLFVLLIGIGSRSWAAALPSFVAAYAPDALWALFVFLAIRFIRPASSVWTAAVFAFSVSVLIEVSQRHHSSWIDALRDTYVGALVLGHSFGWGDLVCYLVGISVGAIAESLFRGLGSASPA